MLCQNFIFPLNGGGSIIKQAVFGEKGTNHPEHHFIYFLFMLPHLFYSKCDVSFRYMYIQSCKHLLKIKYFKYMYDANIWYQTNACYMQILNLEFLCWYY